MGSGEVALRAADALAPGAASDGHLVAACLGGNTQAFGRLVALHEGMVFNLAVRLLGDKEEARDLSQDLFLQVYRTLGRFQGRSSLKTWIYRITVNLCRNRQRFWRRRQQDRCCRLEDLTPAQEARLGEGGGGETPFEHMQRRERAERVQRALLRISFDHRAVLILREVEDLSCEEIAGTLGLPEGTVKSRLARAREALRRLLVPQPAKEERA